MSDMDIEAVLIKGDLAQLSPAQRLEYYKRVCESLGLNPLTRPFDYITLNGRLMLYAKRDAADQLRRIHKISIDPPVIQDESDWIIVTVSGRMPDGRSDAEIGVVNKRDMQGNFGNALMKAVTKAKRRLTLSICGLGWLDETEIDSIPDARPALTSEAEPSQLPEPAPEPEGMPERTEEAPQPAHPAQPAQPQSWKRNPKQLYDRLIHEGLAENPYQAQQRMKKCALSEYAPMDKLVEWNREYVRAKEYQKLDSDAAAAAANEKVR